MIESKDFDVGEIQLTKREIIHRLPKLMPLQSDDDFTFLKQLYTGNVILESPKTPFSNCDEDMSIIINNYDLFLDSLDWITIITNILGELSAVSKLGLHHFAKPNSIIKIKGLLRIYRNPCSVGNRTGVLVAIEGTVFRQEIRLYSLWEFLEQIKTQYLYETEIKY